MNMKRINTDKYMVIKQNRQLAVGEYQGSLHVERRGDLSSFLKEIKIP